MEIRNSLIKFGIAGILSSLIINSSFVIAEWEATSEFGGGFYLWVSLLLIFPLLFCLLIFLVSVVGVFTRYRDKFLKIGCASLTYFLVGVLMLHFASWWRMAAFGKLAERSQHIILAIQQYEADNSQLPIDLKALVPLYLPEIPKTGMGAYPEYNYYIGSKAKKYENNPWVLEVYTSSGGINFDSFFYFPKQNYPEKGYGGVLEKVKDWAYLHE